MGIETRIGIVTGLLIVVVASVYFFYGSDPDESEMLVATGSKVTATPKIPPANDRHRPASGNRLSPEQGSRSAKADAKSASPRPANRRPAISDRSRAAYAKQRDDQQDAARPPKMPAARPPRPTVTKDTIAQDSHPTTAVPSAGSRKSTALRTGPSQDLLDATRENIDDPSSVDNAAEGPRPERSGQIIPPTRESAASETRRQPADGQPRRAASAWPKQHQIVEGDTLVAIAERYYGSGSRFEEIMKANPDIKDSRRLKIGMLLTIPAPGARPESDARVGDRPAHAEKQAATGQPSARPPSAAQRTYTVREGDSFYSIASSLLGRGARWEEIYRLNTALVHDDPKGLKPGMVIRLPR
ncbi:MAG: LysM peptidoglycan-binding domain-containing protein [Planctomycetota bacterium]